MNKRDFLITKIWVYFGYNYPSMNDAIDYICKKTGEGECFKQHLLGKWDSIYDIYGSHAVMNRFYAELSGEYRDALLEYAVEVYGRDAFHWTDEEKEILGYK